MPIKRDSIFNGLIEACDSCLAVPNITIPGDYYGRVKEIRRRAVEAEPNDQGILDKLTGEAQGLRTQLSSEQLKAFDTCCEETQQKKSGGK
jgi:hypothetical protein